MTKETTTDTAGGGQNIGFIEDGDYVSYKPYNLENTTGMRFRVASAGAGGTIEVRLDSPTGTLVGTTPTITPTGDWQTFKDVSLNYTTPPTGTHELFLVFRNKGSTQNLFNVNWFEVVGKGAATTAAPEVTATATPLTGTAPLNVKFDATATDPEGTALTYAWDFGVPGITTDTSTQEDPSYTYTAAGTYSATLTVTDADGGVTTKSLSIRVDSASTCGFRDDFNGSDLDASWSVVRRDQTLTVSDGALNIVSQAGDVYQTANNAKNLVLRAAPSGPWVMTTKLNFKGLVQYQQAGLIVYGDDDNYTKFDRAATNTTTGTNTEKFEFINEVAGTPRNGSADASANLASTFPNDFYMRVTSDGTNITGEYSADGTTWTKVGQTAALPANAKIGLFSLSNAAATTVPAKFDYVTVTGPNAGGSGGPGDDFTGSSLDKTKWNGIVREDATKYNVSNGALNITTVEGDLYTNSDSTGTRNLMLQTADHAAADYVLETKVTTNLAGGYGQGGIIVYTDDDNYVKLDAISDVNNARINRIELRSETAAAIGNPQPEFTSVPTGTTTIWLRLTKAGTSYSGEYSFDGTTWTAMSAAVTHAQTGAKFGLYTLGVQTAGAGANVSFDYFKVNGTTGCGGGWPDQRHAGHLVRDGDAQRGLRSAGDGVHRRGDRRRQRCAHVLVGLRRQRHDGRDGRLGVQHVHHRRHQDGEAHRHRRQGRHGDAERLGAGPGRGQRPAPSCARWSSRRPRRSATTRSRPPSPPSRRSARRRTGRSTAPRTRVLHGRDPEPLRRRDLQLDDG